MRIAGLDVARRQDWMSLADKICLDSRPSDGAINSGVFS
jgi:hypothetical protein